MKTNLKITKITTEEMMNLATTDGAYNPQIWKQRVTSLAKYEKCQFYFEDATERRSYKKFYASYIADGIYFFSEFNAFCSAITNNGFCKVGINAAGEVHKYLFTSHDGKEGYAENCKANRDMFRRNFTRLEIMVCNSL